MGRIIQGLNNKVAHVYEAERGDIEFRILGYEGKRFMQVAIIHDADLRIQEARKFADKTRKAFREWFSSPPYQDILVQQIKTKKKSPLEIWSDIKKYYSLPSDYDFK